MDGSKKSSYNQIEKHEWHALSIDNVFEILSTNVDGLSELDVVERTSEYGHNIFTKTKSVTIFERIFEQLKSPLTLVLLIAFFVTLALADYLDASVIIIAMLIAVIVGVLQEGKAFRAFEKLSNSQVKTAIVIRDGRKYEIEASMLVLGDVVVIQNGMQVPADLRIIESKKLAINESSLTGEWVAVSKDNNPVDVGVSFAEYGSMAHMGTFVAEGHGRGVVVATGDNTYIGGIACDISLMEDEITPIQWEMAKISRIMVIIITVLIVGIFSIGVFGGESLETMLITSIAIAVAAIPEGLPAAVVIVLAVGMESLLKRGGLVRNLLAAETLGSTTYILTDKTGTLTEAKMAITGIVYSNCILELDDERCGWSDDENVKKLFDIALCASDGFFDEHDGPDLGRIAKGEPIERAILESADSLGLSVDIDSMRVERIELLTFESKNSFAAGLAPFEDKYKLCINGAPELLLGNSVCVLTKDGVVDINAEFKQYFNNQITEHTSLGKRLIAVGYKDVDYDDIPDEVDGLLNNMVFVGLIIIDDPVRKGVEKAITGVLSAGVQIRLVTGDNPDTALSIARNVGIAHEHDIALTGDYLAKLNDSELLEVLHDTYVFARVLPRQKMRLARVLQASGEIVAMTGDGINDAPALRKANIGVAIGSGTEVAKEASDLVLINDSFSTIYSAIEEGRRIIGNLRHIVSYLLATSLSETVLIAAALLTGAALPILPAQILWANIIEEGLMSVAFAFELGDKNAMKQKPRDINKDGVLSHEVIIFSGFVISVLSILLVSLYVYLRITDISIEGIRSIMFLAISIDSLFIAFSFRSLSTPLWNVPLRTNIFFMVSFAISMILLLVVISIPFFQGVFSYVPVTISEFVLVFGYGVACLVAIEVGKYFFFYNPLSK